MPLPELQAMENPSAEALLDSLKSIGPAERRQHASVFNYWLSIRGQRQFPPIRDLDPLEISDAGPWSVLLEMVGGGDDAVIRHFGQELRASEEIERVAEAPAGSLLSIIHGKLPIVAACREAYAFEECFNDASGEHRCWVTLLPFSSNGSWIDYVYGYVSRDDAEPAADDGAVEPQGAQAEEETAAEPDTVGPIVEFAAEPDPQAEAGIVEFVEPQSEPEAMAEFEPGAEADVHEPETESRPSFTAKVMESLASVGSRYSKASQMAPEMEHAAEDHAIDLPEAEPDFQSGPEPEPEPIAAEDDLPQPAVPPAEEGNLHSKLTDVRALAEEAREAQVRSNIALYEGLSAAYDFALDAEDQPEEYLRLVEAQGLKIQLRSPMKPVVKLAFEGMCDEPTIQQLEAVLAWALKNDLPKGSLAERIQAEGGIGQILNPGAA